MADQTLLEIHHVSKTFGRLEAIRDVSLHIDTGDIYALLGPNGAGKTTLLSLILGLLRPTAGQIHFAGGPGQMAGFLGIPPVYPHLSGYENLRLSFYMRGVAVDHKHIEQVLEMVGLADARHRDASEYSTGMRQRLGIARALLFPARLIMLDEPTNGLDPEGIVEIRELIRRLHRERGITWLISSHLLSEVEQIASRVGILVDGSLRFEDRLTSLQSDKNLYEIETPHPEQAKAALPAWAPLQEENGHRLVVRLVEASPARLNQHLVEQGIAISHLSRRINRLEAMYLHTCYGVPLSTSEEQSDSR